VNQYDERIAAARAKVDQSLARTNHTLDEVVLDHARMFLAAHPATDAWALLSSYVAKELDCTSDTQCLAARLVAAASIRLVQAETGTGSGTPD